MPATVRRGDRGDDVELLQRALRDLHYEVGTVDGDFGQRTEDALTAHQHDYNLSSVEPAVCGEATWASIEGQFGTLEGLRSEASLQQYVGQAYGIWNSSQSAEDRIAALEAECNHQLTAAGAVSKGRSECVVVRTVVPIVA